MKKLLLSLALGTAVTLSANAQKESEFKPFKVDLSLGYAIPGGSGAKAGILFAVEPKYAVINNLSVGLRMEAAVVARVSGYNSDGSAVAASVKAAGSYLATGDYYFNDNYSFRPFAGAGAGLFTIAAAEVTSSTEAVGASRKFGGLLRAGFEASHFRLGVEYNLVPNTTFNGFDFNGEPAKVTSKNSYIGLKLGVCIGGGPR